MRGAGFSGSGHAHEVEVQRQTLAQALVEQQQAAGDALARGGVAVLLGDAEEGAEQLQDRQERDRLAVRDAGGLVGHQAARPAALEELEAQAALAEPGVADDADDLGVALAGARQRRLEHLHLVAAADEAREAAAARDVEARAHLPEPLQLVARASAPARP